MELKILDALLLQFFGSRLEARIFLVVVFQDTVIHLRLIDEVAAQIGLAEARPCLVIGIGNLRHTDIGLNAAFRSEENTSELQSLMRISYAVFCLKKKNKQ